MKSNCKNCGSSEFKDGKCAYCGTDYGLTGDKIQDEWLIANKRKATMEADGWEFYVESQGQYSAHCMKKDDYTYCVFRNNYFQMIEGLWEEYCQLKYKQVMPIK